MRIACIMEMAGSRFEGGRELATRHLIDSLRRAGAQVDIYSFASGCPRVLSRFFRETPFVRAVTAFPLAGYRLLKSLDGRYDLIHITSTSTASLYSPVTPTLLYCHGVIAHKWEKFEFPLVSRLVINSMSQAVMAWFERRCMRNVKAVIAVHPATLEFIKRGLGIQGESLYLLGNGVDADLFKPAPTQKEGVIFVGRATKSKGFDTLLQAVPGIRAPVTAAVYQCDEQLVSEARSLGVEVLLNVPHEEMPALYNRSAVFALPSIDEELPLATLEALACGLPVVVSRAAAAGIVEDGLNGIIVPTGDPVALAEALNRILDDDGLRTVMGDKSRVIAESSLTWDDVAEGYLRICSVLMRKENSTRA